MLHKFLSLHRTQLIGRWSQKAAQRPEAAADARFGVPRTIDQLIEALAAAQGAPDSPESSRVAALHGSELSRLGYTVEQVVHDYGDLCQAVTELAREYNASVTLNEFQTLNRVLDNAIASAVSAHARERHASDFEDARSLHERMGTLADEQRMLLETALRAFDALRAGDMGLKGATASLLEDSLLRLREVVDRSLPEIRVASGIVTPRSA